MADLEVRRQSSSQSPSLASSSRLRNNNFGVLLALAGSLSLAGFFWGHPLYGRNLLAGLLLILIALPLGLIGLDEASRRALTLNLPSGRTVLWYSLAALLLLHLGLALRELRAWPGDDIDSYTFQRDSVQSLLHGVDPFGTTHANPYTPEQAKLLYGPGLVVDNRVQVGLQYPPLSFLLAVPGYLLGDVRLGYVIGVMASAVLLFATVPDIGGFLLAALLLLSPATFIVESRCWTEPLVWMTLCAAIFAMVRKPRYLPIALGLFFASKQYNLVALPLLGFFQPRFSWKAYGRLLFISCSVAAATLLPFAVWNMRALWHDLIVFHITQPFRIDAVSFGVPFPVMQKVGPLLLVAFLVWCARMQKPNATVFLAGYAIALLLVFATSKQAFLNYYFLISNTFFFAALLAFYALPVSPPSRESHVAQS